MWCSLVILILFGGKLKISVAEFPTTLPAAGTYRDRQCIKIPVLNYDQVSWQLKGAKYPITVSNFSFISNGRYQVENDEEGEWNLLIKRVRRSDSGIYQCRVTTQTMLLVREVHLTVQGEFTAI